MVDNYYAFVDTFCDHSGRCGFCCTSCFGRGYIQMNVYYLSMIVFTSQFLFIGARTWNIRAIAEKKMTNILLSGFVIHLFWLISITIGVTSMVELMKNFQPEYLFVILASASGGLLSSYLVMKKGS